MAHRREPGEPKGRRIRTWTIGTAILVAFAAAVVLAVLAVWP